MESLKLFYIFNTEAEALAYIEAVNAYYNFGPGELITSWAIVSDFNGIGKFGVPFAEAVPIPGKVPEEYSTTWVKAE